MDNRLLPPIIVHVSLPTELFPSSQLVLQIHTQVTSQNCCWLLDFYTFFLAVTLQKQESVSGSQLKHNSEKCKDFAMKQ